MSKEQDPRRPNTWRPRVVRVSKALATVGTAFAFTAGMEGGCDLDVDYASKDQRDRAISHIESTYPNLDATAGEEDHEANVRCKTAPSFAADQPFTIMSAEGDVDYAIRNEGRLERMNDGCPQPSGSGELLHVDALDDPESASLVALEDFENADTTSVS